VSGVRLIEFFADAMGENIGISISHACPVRAYPGRGRRLHMDKSGEFSDLLSQLPRGSLAGGAGSPGR